MNIGIVYPQTEFGNDPAAMRDYAQTAEALGFAHVVAYDHVLGANPNRPGWRGFYTHESAFQEPLVLFSYMAAVTQRIEFCTGIIILPQRQAALVAKQAASLDVLSRGRLRLGVAIGWNPVEFLALNQDWHFRAARMEEQIELMRRLWTEPLVTFSGRWHTVPDAGLNPLPAQRPIPLWLGGYVDATARRAARLADGWIMGYSTAAEARPWVDRLDTYLAEAGRSRPGFGLEAVVTYEGDPGACAALAAEWGALGLTHLTFDLMGQGLATPGAHLAAIRDIAKALGLG
jgi:probable F420-dependent oxidoreductase